MVDDLTVPQVQLADGSHVVPAQDEVPDVQVLCHPFLVGGFGDDDHPTLGVPAQHHLCRGLAVLLADVSQQGMGEDAVVALRQRPPGFRLDAQRLHVCQGVGLGEEGMQLHLVDHGLDAGVAGQVGEPFRVEVAHANGANFACLVQLFHGAPGAVVVAKGLVDEIQVQIIQPQLVQGGLERLLGVFIAGVLNPQLGGDEQLLPGDARLAQGCAYGFLVEIGGGGAEIFQSLIGLPESPVGQFVSAVLAQDRLPGSHCLLVFAVRTEQRGAADILREGGR